MEDILKRRIEESKGRTIKIILLSNYIYTGKILNTDDKYIEMLDYKTNKIHIFTFENIKDFEERE